MSISLLLVFSCLLASCSKEQANVQDTNGHTVAIKQLQKKWLVLNYWAIWCPPCMQEVPALNRFYKRYQNSKKVAFYGISFDPMQTKELISTMQKVNIKFPVLLHDPAKLFSLPTPGSLPVTYIIRPGGKLAKVLYGADKHQRLDKALTKLQKQYD